MNAEENKGVIVKATFWYMISNILLRGMSLLTAPIFTRLLSTADYGIASNFNSWLNIISCISGLSLATAALRGKAEFKENYKSFLSSIQTLGITFCLLCAIIMFCTIGFWSDLMELNRVCVAVMLLYLIVSPSVSFTQIDYQFDYCYRENIGISIFNAAGTLFFTILMIYMYPNEKYMGRIYGLILPGILMGTLFLFRIFRKGRCLYKKEYWIYALKLSLPMIPHGFAMLVLGQIDRVMIIKYCGESHAGIYSFGYSYAVLLSVITNAISDGIKPQMFRFLDNKEDNTLVLFVHKIVIGTAALSLYIIALAPEALRILATKEYYDARWVVFPVVVGTLMQFMYQNFNIIQLYYKKTIYTAIGSVSAAIVNFILNMIFIPQFGFVAAAYTTMISYGFLMLFHYMASCLVAKRKVYPMVFFIIILAVTILMGFVFNLLYDTSFYYRYLLIVLMTGIFLFFMRKEITSVFLFIRKRR